MDQPQEVEVISRADTMRAVNDQYFTQRATQDRDFIYDKLKELSEGVWIWFKSPDGSQTRAYKSKPDVKAVAILKEQAAGKIQPEDDSSRRQSEGIISLRNLIKSYIDDKPRLIESTEAQISQGVSDEAFSE